MSNAEEKADRSSTPKVALFVRDLHGFSGDAKLYKVSPPMKGYGDDEAHEYVIVSAAHVMFSGPETYIFPGDEAGKVTSWGELPGSYRGGLDHEEALREAGYEVRHG